MRIKDAAPFFLWLAIVESSILALAFGGSLLGQGNWTWGTVLVAVGVLVYFAGYCALRHFTKRKGRYA